MNFWKNLKSQLTGKTPETNKDSNRTNASPSPSGRGKGEGESDNSRGDTQSSFSDTDFDLKDNRNGKIARLPRPLRERINHALYHRFTAKQLARELNKMPEVKAVLGSHFGGRPIITQNIYEWKNGGYRDWLRRRQILEKQSELTADAKDMADTADGMADSLFGMLTLDYARLMMNRDGDDETFEKKRKALSTLAQDVVRLRRCHLNARRVQIQETKLENETEKTEEQLLLKFTEWTDNPQVRKACILAPMERDRRMRILAGLPPRPEDPLVERETRNDPYFGHFDKNQTKTKPNQTTKSNNRAARVSKREQPSASPASERIPNDAVGPRSSAAEPNLSRTSEKTPESNDDSKRPNASPSPGGEGRGEGELNSSGPQSAQNDHQQSTHPPIQQSNPYAGKTTQDIIAECEENYARQKAARLNPDRQKDAVGRTTRASSCVAEPNSSIHSSTNPPIRSSDDHHSICRPKPNPLDSFSEPVHYAPQPGPTRPLYGPCEPPLTASSQYNLRPPPGFNSLG